MSLGYAVPQCTSLTEESGRTVGDHKGKGKNDKMRDLNIPYVVRRGVWEKPPTRTTPTCGEVVKVRNEAYMNRSLKENERSTYGITSPLVGRGSEKSRSTHRSGVSYVPEMEEQPEGDTNRGINACGGGKDGGTGYLETA